MAKTKTRRRRAQVRPVQASRKRQETGRLPTWASALAGALLIAAVAGGALLLGKDKAQSGSEGPAVGTGGLPNTFDYHSLLVAPNDPEHILLEPHAGLYESTDDGGETWSDVRPAGLPSLDVHGFAVDPRDQTLWAAVAGEGLYRSTDAGASFEVVSEEVVAT